MRLEGGPVVIKSRWKWAEGQLDRAKADTGRLLKMIQEDDFDVYDLRD